MAYDRERLRHTCWHLLSQMLGLQTSEACPEPLPSGSPSHLARPARQLYRVCACLEPFADSTKPPLGRSRAECKQDVVCALGRILHPQQYDLLTPRISLECQRGNEYRQALDDPLAGYSRDPFKHLDKEHRPTIALGAAGYLARAHAYFFCRPRRKRTVNRAKVSLNDLFQSTQLACRLYYTLASSHLKTYSHNEYLAGVRLGLRADRPPWEEPFFVWSTLQLCEIQRGIIYRQLRNLEEADRFLRHAKNRFQHLLGGSPLDVHHASMTQVPQDHPSPDRYLVTPTVIGAFSERGKVLFDRGLFVESLMSQIFCLAALTRIATDWRPPTGRQLSVLESISKGLKLLDVVRKESVWDKEIIVSLIGGANGEREPHLRPLLQRDFAGWLRRLDPSARSLAVDLYARIGLTLFILRRGSHLSVALELTPEFKTTLRPFFTMHEPLEVKPSSLALDARTIVLMEATPDATGVAESLERALARRLRTAIDTSLASGRLPKESSFFGGVLESATRNIPNIVTLPDKIKRFLIRRGYAYRRNFGELSGPSVESTAEPDRGEPSEDRARARDKFTVLRRWQSFNPKIPRPNSGAIRGGGYFLRWCDKGIVIDPGYDFLQNLYDEGFSLEDVDAVVVTHSHPDHDDDLSTFSTLVREWNEYFHLTGRRERELRLDFFLNESAHLKFAGWLKASQAGIGRIIPLPLVAWNLDSKDPGDAFRGKNVVLNLRERYGLDLEVVPAWHDDVLSRTAAVGLKFHLFAADDKARKVGIVGITGDSGAYPLPSKGSFSGVKIEDQYADCDVLVAHLGDARLRELFTVLDRPPTRAPLGKVLGRLLRDRFCDRHGRLDQASVTPDDVNEFFRLLVILDLAPKKVLNASIGTVDERPTVAEALRTYCRRKPLAIRGFDTYASVIQQLPSLLGIGKLEADLHAHLARALNPSGSSASLSSPEVAYSLLALLCFSARRDWHYEYHLGTAGVYRVHQAMVAACRPAAGEGASSPTRILVVGELPEELSSYRHHVARLLNLTAGRAGGSRRAVEAFTGDIGLHISLDIDGKDDNRRLTPRIRCTYCNYNNETALPMKNYHAPGKIMETPLKRLDSAMIYLCTEYDHHPENELRPYDFLSRPALRVV